MSLNQKIRQFFFPPLTTKFLIRVSLVALSAYLFFTYVCIPLRVEGRSMEPTYPHGSFNFCCRFWYLLAKPKRHDVVAVRFAGNRVMLFKRVVAVEGEEVEFRDGKLFVDGKQMDEPYVRYSCDWNLPPRRVEKDHVYVVGDNRSMALENHVFGQAVIDRIVGAAVW